ncbi:MAG: efflux RND transporter periplasmic adaptor subunit [Mariprofundaceae bacterium]|nr:efflux RND transporter periplasmic adaptor subunit [Mariprofundaceae bacterium]
MISKNIITAALILTAGVAAGYLLAPTADKSEKVSMQQNSSEAREPLFYRNPMNPAITSPVPAQDEMGMDYIPVYADDGGDVSAPAGTVKINPTVAQNIGVRTTRARLATLSRTIRTIGRVTFDEERVARLHPKYDGWIEKLFIDRTGDRVSKGTMLMAIYSPQLVATQEEYLLALNSAESVKESPFPDVREGAGSLLRSALERLQLLDVPVHQIKKLETERKVMKGVHIHSPFDGVVMSIGAREGSRITPETELYMIADLSRVWVIVDLYEDDMPWVRVGDVAAMKVAGVPGSSFTGKVSYIYPYLEAKTRTVKMRLEFDNPELVLKPDMFANVTVKAGRQINAVVIPSEAIVRTGEQEQVFVQRGPGKYTPRKVVVGVDSEGQAQIIEGLKAGETVVTSGQFLIDSESKLREATAKMLEVGASNSITTVPQGSLSRSAIHLQAQRHDPWKSPTGDEGMNMDGMEGMSMDKMQMHNHSAKQPGTQDTPQMEGMQMDGMPMENGKAKGVKRAE